MTHIAFRVHLRSEFGVHLGDRRTTMRDVVALAIRHDEWQRVRPGIGACLHAKGLIR